MKTSETLSLISHFFIKHLFTEVFLQGQTIQERKEREREKEKARKQELFISGEEKPYDFSHFLDYLTEFKNISM